MSTLLYLADTRVALVGSFAAMAKRKAGDVVRELGGTVVQRPEAANLVIVGEDDLPLIADADELGLRGVLDQAAIRAADEGRLEVVSESQFWQRLGLLEDDRASRSCTARMLAELLRVPISTVRCWRRQGLIEPVREVLKLEYYDFQQVQTARRLAELVASGISPQRIESQLAALRRILPEVDRPLAQLSLIAEGKHLLLRQSEGLIDSAGQMRFDFDLAAEPPRDDAAADGRPCERRPATIPFARLVAHEIALDAHEALSSGELLDAAAYFEDQGDLSAAEESLRAALAAGGPNADVCFQLAELLYRRGDLPAARERYFAAVELDENFVEARANLGCVLAELGQSDLAQAAFEGALRHHPDYPDAHYHLARLLRDAGRPAKAAPHWRAFLELSPNSPWAEEAEGELARMDGTSTDRG